MMTTPNDSAVDTHRVVFTPAGVMVNVRDGSSVLDAARQGGVDLDSTCGGRGICGRCQIVPTTGTFPTWDLKMDEAALSSWASTEEDYRGRRPILDGQRLGCAALIHADAVIGIPAASQVHQPVVTKSVGQDDISDFEVDPIVRLYYIELSSDGVGSITDQIVDGLIREFGVRPANVDTHLLPILSPASASGRMTVAVRRDRTICGVASGYRDRALGIAVDIGSTTVAGHLVDLSDGAVLASSSRMNPQIRFGDDLMSRVSYAMTNPNGSRELTQTIRTSLNDLIDDLLGKGSANVDELFDIVLVGNPVMHHVVLGIDPTPLGQAPFLLATDGPVTTRAVDLELSAPFAEVYLLPCIAGHVGGDTAAAILAEGPHRSEKIQLLIDVGTNAEIVLGQRHALYSASSPTGPAFEGAQISAGTRAFAGAIERVRIDATTLEPRVKVIGKTAWSDDPEFNDKSSDPNIAGICGSGIIEAIGELYLAGVIDTDGTIRGDLAEVNGGPTTRVFPNGRTYSYRLFGEANHPSENVNVTQEDVRAVQLAKAALRAGVDLLIERSGITDPSDIDSVRIAGAFGAHIDPLYAKVIGLVPDTPIDRVRSVGNAAGVGAIRALLSAAERKEIERTARRVQKVETAVEPRFQELFVAAMGFPHSSTPTPNLATETTMPNHIGPARRPRRRRVRQS